MAVIYAVRVVKPETDLNDVFINLLWALLALPLRRWHRVFQLLRDQFDFLERSLPGYDNSSFALNLANSAFQNRDQKADLRNRRLLLYPATTYLWDCLKRWVVQVVG